jgi:hypothetical protein
MSPSSYTQSLCLVTANPRARSIVATVPSPPLKSLGVSGVAVLEGVGGAEYGLRIEVLPLPEDEVRACLSKPYLDRKASRPRLCASCRDLVTAPGDVMSIRLIVER